MSNICRVCRSTSTAQEPLFHPCKCSGSIGYVHQTCLEEWLSHSKKTKCEICNYSFIFSSIYSSEAPSSLPISLIFYAIAKKSFYYINRSFRYLLAFISWFLLVPLSTLWLFSSLFRPLKDSLSFSPPIVSEYWKILLQSYIITFSFLLTCISIVTLREIIIANTLEEDLASYRQQRKIIKELKQAEKNRDKLKTFKQKTAKAIDVTEKLGSFRMSVTDELGSDTKKRMSDLEFDSIFQLQDQEETEPSSDDLNASSSSSVAQTRSQTKIPVLNPEKQPANNSFSQNLYTLELPSKRMWYIIDPTEMEIGPFNWMRMESMLEKQYITPETIVRRADHDHVIQISELLASKPASWPYVFFMTEIDEETSYDFKTANGRSSFSVVDRNNEIESSSRTNTPEIPVPEPQPVVQADNDEEDEIPIQDNNGDDVEALININIGPDMQIEIEANGEANAIMELVGAAGPISNLFRSLLIYYAILLAVFFIFISLPRVLGYYTIWLYQNIMLPVIEPRLKYLQFNLNYLTDPIIDPLVEWILLMGKMFSYFMVGGLEKIVAKFAEIQPSWMSDILFNITISALKTFTTKNVTEDAISFVTASVNSNLTESSFVITAITESLSDGASVLPVIIPTTDAFNTSLNIISNLTISGNNASTNAAKDFVSVNSEFILSILIGHAELFLILVYNLWSENELQHPYILTIKRMFLKFVEGVFLSVKFIFFITIELGVFPTYCGFLIDICSIPVLGNLVTIQSRIDFFNRHMGVWSFFHWIVGTTFMFQFAIYVSLIRSIIRPGVLWFVRDPNDPRFQPLNDIISKPILYQLRKLFIGASLYTSIIVCYVGGFVGLSLGIQSLLNIESGIFKIWPLRWDFNDTLLQFPLDLIIFHFIAPPFLIWVNPKKTFRSFVTWWFRISAKTLCLSAFLFGGRHEDEERDIVIERNATDISDKSKYRFLRVPNHDSIELTPGVRDVLVAMRENDELFGRQHETPEEVKSNWTKVYIPYLFKTRVVFLALWHQLTANSLAIALFVLPIIIGRAISFKIASYLSNSYGIRQTVFPNLVSGRMDLVCHDLYSLILGVIAIAIIYYPLKYAALILRFGYSHLQRRNAIKRSALDRSETNIENSEDKPSLKSKLVTWYNSTGKKTIRRFIAFTIIFFWGVLVLPLSGGLFIELCVLKPLNIPFNYEFPTSIVNYWIYGSLLLKITYFSILLLPERFSIRQELTNLSQRGLDTNMYNFHVKIILPLLQFFVICVFVPMQGYEVLSQKYKMKPIDGNIKPFVQTLVVIAVITSWAYIKGRDFVRRILDSIRDDEFKVGRTLHNFNQESVSTGEPVVEERID